jgi:hypothetical protein
MKHIQPTSSRCLHPICSARSRNYRGNFYITVQEADGEERRVSKLLYPGWKKLTTAKRVAEEMLHAWDLNIGRASWAVPHILRIYDNTTLIEAHYWDRQNADVEAPPRKTPNQEQG